MWGWFPLVVYVGLQQGTHKFEKPGLDPNSPPDGEAFLERAPSWTDCLPLFNTAHQPNAGMAGILRNLVGY